MKRDTTKAIRNLRYYYPNLYESITRCMIEEMRTVRDYMSRAVKVFEEHDQGSLSFTETALRHKGYDFPSEILEVIDQAYRIDGRTKRKR